jgi:hypothetical protein
MVVKIEMKVNYQYWEQNKGFEEKQAKIYNEHNPGPQPATEQQIIERYKREEIDPKTVRYAFSKEGKLLAYIQARDYTEIKETHLGYPWAISSCPEEVQDKLFDEMLDYIKQREQANEYKIRMNASIQQSRVVDFFKKKNLSVKLETYRFNLDIKKISHSKYSDSEYTTRLATNDDLDLLVNLLKADGRFTGQFSSDDDIVNYFKDRVLKDGHAILVFKNEKLVMASAPLIFKLPNDEERESLIMRFHSFLKGNEKAFEPLLIGLAKECVDTNYGIDKPFAIFAAGDDEFISVIEKYNPEKIVNGFSFGLEELD